MTNDRRLKLFPEYRELISRLKNEDAHFSVLFQRHNELEHEVSREEAVLRLTVSY
jgi:hypothetical protein